ncbi:hypothetical protein ACW0JT_20175 [Arthrobacter sp. SA17]
MASTRRPTYKPSGSRQGSGKTPVGKAQTAGDRQHSGIISASKSADDLGGQPAAALPDNVVNFPEPKARRIRRNIIITASIVAALVAGLIAAAIYSPALAVRTITVQGTKMLTTEQIQTALEPLEGKPLPQVNDSRSAHYCSHLSRSRLLQRRQGLLQGCWSRFRSASLWHS